MSANTKTIKVIVYPDGTTSSITRSSRGWAWYPPQSGKHESSDLRGVASNAGMYGGRIEIRPNPYYRAPKPLTGFDVLNAALTKAFSARRR